ncbi:hypothetical protein D3C87_1801220 [compost metagenome]
MVVSISSSREAVITVNVIIHFFKPFSAIFLVFYRNRNLNTHSRAEFGKEVCRGFGDLYFYRDALYHFHKVPRGIVGGQE